MAEDAADFLVRLHDKVSGPGDRAAAAFRKVADAAERATAAARKVPTGTGPAAAGLGRMGSEAKRTERAVEALRKELQDDELHRLESAIKSTDRALRRMNGGVRRSSAAYREFFAMNDRARMSMLRTRAQLNRFVSRPSLAGFLKLNRFAGEARQEFGQLFSVLRATPLGMLAGGLFNVAGGLGRIAMRAVSAAMQAGKLLTILGGIAAVALTKKVVEFGILGERVKTALTFMEGGDTGRGEKAFLRLRGIARDLSLDMEEVLDQGMALRRARFTQGESEELLKLTADMRAIGVTADQTNRAVAAITQIKAKGRLQSEELVQQLAEAGVSTIAVFEQLEKQTGKSRKEVRALLETGKIDADMGLDAVRAAIKAQLGITEAGTAARKFATETTAGLLQTLKVVPKQLFMDVAERVKEMGTFRDTLKDAIRLIDMPISGREGMAKFIDNMLKLLRNAMILTGDFMRGFGEEFGRVTKAIDFGPPSKEMRDFAKGAGKGLASFFVALPKIIGVAFDALQGFARGLGLTSQVNGLNTTLDQIDFDKLGERASGAAEAVGTTIRKMFEDLSKGEFLVNVGRRLWDGLWGGFRAAMKDVDFARIMNEAILGKKAADFLDKTDEVSSNLIGGFTKGLEQQKARWSNLFTDPIGEIKAELGIHSPSKVTQTMGENVAEGFAVGMEDGGTKVDRSVAKVIPFPVERASRPSQVAATTMPRATIVGQAGRQTSTGPVAQVTIPISIHGRTARDNRELVELLKQQITEALTEFVDGPLAEAVGE